MVRRILFLALPFCLITACTNSNVSAIQDMTLPGDPSLTVGQAFNHRTACDSVEWKTMKDDRDRNIVEYRCNFKNVHDYIARVLASTEKQLRNQGAALRGAYDGQVEDAQEELTRSKATGSQERIAEAQRQYDKLFAERKEQFDKLDKAVDQQMEKLKSGNLITKVSEVFQWAVPADKTEAVITYAGLEETFKDGTHRSQGYRRFDVPLSMIANNEAVDFTSYNKQLNNVSDLPSPM